MNGIASLLDQAAGSLVESMWHELEYRCGLVGVKSTIFPHFSWQVTEGYDLPRLESTLQEVSRQSKPFTIRTVGLGIFPGEKPVLYISIFKDESLIRFHSLLWEKTKGIAIRPIFYYAPSEWVPHITLAYNDVNQVTMNCALKTLAYHTFDWEVRIDNLVYVAQTDGQTTDIVRFQLGN